MDDQRSLPPAFLAIYQDARGRLTLSREALLARHELCEDLCQELAPHGRGACVEFGLPAQDVATRVLDTLPGEGLGLTPAECAWMTGRLAELMEQG